MTDEREQALGMIEDAIAALVVQKHGPGREKRPLHQRRNVREGESDDRRARTSAGHD